MSAYDPLDLIRANPGIWLETFGSIRNVSGHQERPKMNILQRRINALYMSKRIVNQPCRCIGVKPRKRGFSTMVGAIQYHQLMQHRHEGVIIGDRLETSQIVFRMMVNFAESDEFRNNWDKAGQRSFESTTEELRFGHGSVLRLGTARGKATARGMTPQFEHWTEAAHWEGAAEAMDAAMNAIPDEGFNAVFQESTPFGQNEPFHLNWLAARWPTEGECPGGKQYWKQWESVCPDQPKDHSGLGQFLFVRVFAAWYEFEESRIRLTEDQKGHIRKTLDAESWYRGEQRLIDLYGNEGPQGLRIGDEVEECDVWEQLAWRRNIIKTKCRGSSRIFDEEHPSDPHSCFLASGRQVFDDDSLTRIQILTRVQPEYGQLNPIDRRATWIRAQVDAGTVQRWEKPVVGARYICAVDLAEGEDQTKGEDPDAHSALILRDEYIDHRRGYHRAAVVARIKPPCRAPMIPFASLVRLLSIFYGRCVIIPEMNNSGMAFITAMRMIPDSPPIWQRKEVDPHSLRERSWDGWRTTDNAEYGGLRATIIWHLHDALRNDRLHIPCPHVHSELANFVDKKGRMEAGSGHDDDVMALAIGYYNIGAATEFSDDRAYASYTPPDLLPFERTDQSDLAMRW